MLSILAQLELRILLNSDKLAEHADKAVGDQLHFHRLLGVCESEDEVSEKKNGLEKS